MSVSQQILTLYTVCSTRYDLLKALAPEDGTPPNPAPLIAIGFDRNIFTHGRLQVIRQRRQYFEGVILAFASEYSTPPCPSDQAIGKMLERTLPQEPAFDLFEREVLAIDAARKAAGVDK
jgi:hypothetical protein